MRYLCQQQIQYPYLETDKNGKVLVPWNNGKFRTKKGKKFPLCRQNTDPFVFSSPFIYCWCKQGHFKVLRQLERGSIILFGSTISSKIGGNGNVNVYLDGRLIQRQIAKKEQQLAFSTNS